MSEGPFRGCGDDGEEPQGSSLPPGHGNDPGGAGRGPGDRHDGRRGDPPEDDSRPSPVWLDWFSPVRLAGFKGNTLLIARQPGPARDTLQDVLDRLPEDSAKQRSVILGDLAAVAVSEKDPERACALAEEALDHLARYWYATGMDRVRAVRESLTKWESRPCVRQLDERLYDWNTTVNALTG